MIKTDLSKLTDEELLAEQQKMKSGKLVNGVLIGFLVGVAVYSAVTKGIGFFTFFPLAFAYIIFRNRKRFDAVEEEIRARGL